MDEQLLSNLSNAMPKLLDQLIKKVEEGYKNIKKPNIMLIGKTGAGKSTLVNAMFRENICETGVGEPITSEIRKYEKEDVPIRIYDTPGMELTNINDITNQVKDTILKLRKTAEEAIHVIWFCIDSQGGRIEKDEIDFIQELSKDHPMIIVLTKDYFPNEKEFYQKIKSLNLPVKNVVRVNSLAKSEQIPTRGLDTIGQVTFQCLPDIVKKGFTSALGWNVKQFLEDKKAKSKKAVIAYSTATFAEGFTPIPFSDIAIILPTQIAMLANISIIFGFSIEKGVAKTFIGSLGATGVGTAARTIIPNLLKMIPGIGTVAGGTISGVMASGITYALGMSYIKVLDVMIRKEVDQKKQTKDDIMQMAQEEFDKRRKEKLDELNRRKK